MKKLERVTCTNNWSKVLCKLGSYIFMQYFMQSPVFGSIFPRNTKSGAFLYVFSK